jgi:hypothetical protein
LPAHIAASLAFWVIVSTVGFQLLNPLPKLPMMPVRSVAQCAMADRLPKLPNEKKSPVAKKNVAMKF